MDVRSREKNKNRKSALALAVVLSVGLAAEPGAFGQQKTGPCADDAARLCKDVQPGGGRVAKCLKEHEDELSPACQSEMPRGGRRQQRQ